MPRHLSALRLSAVALVLAGLAFARPVAAEPATRPAHDRILLLLGNGYNVGEFHGTYFALRAAGYKVDVAGPVKGTIEAGSKNRDLDWPADLALDQVHPADYFALAIPGGGSPANLEKFPKSIEIVQAFAKDRKPIAAICHGPRLLMRAGVLKTRVATSLWKVKDELAQDWITNYGCYLDQQVVEDDELTTARYPNDVGAFATAFLKNYERHGGLKIPAARAKALVVAPGLTGPTKWVFSGALEPVNVKATMAASVADAAKLENLKDFDALILLNTKPDAPEAKPLIAAFAPTRQVLAFPEATLATAGNALPQIATAAHKSAEGRPTVSQPATPLYTAAIQLVPGFDPRACIAAEAWLKAKGYNVAIVNDQIGWKKSNEGYPVFASMTHAGAQDPRQLAPAAIVAIPVDNHPKTDRGQNPIVTLNLNTHASKEGTWNLQGVMQAAVGKYVTPNAGIDGFIVVAPGFDEKAAFATLALAQVASLKNLVFVAAEKGPVRSLNGLTVQADDFSFAERLTKQIESYKQKPILVAPGGFWPESADKTRKQRAEFLAKQYPAGATLYAFGTDAYLLAKEGGLKDTASWKWATTDQAVWSFDKAMGGYAGDPALLTAERLYTVKSGEHVADLWKLLDAKK